MYNVLFFCVFLLCSSRYTLSSSGVLVMSARKKKNRVYTAAATAMNVLNFVDYLLFFFLKKREFDFDKWALHPLVGRTEPVIH